MSTVEERADSFAPAHVRVNWVGSLNIPGGGSATLNVPPPAELGGNVFEYVPSTQTLRIKARGVFGSFVFVAVNATASGVINVLMRRLSPLHEFGVGSCPYIGVSPSTFFVGGVRFVNVPAPADYYIHVTNTSTIAAVTLTQVSVLLTYVGRR